MTNLSFSAVLISLVLSTTGAIAANNCDVASFTGVPSSVAETLSDKGYNVVQDLDRYEMYLNPNTGAIYPRRIHGTNPNDPQYFISYKETLPDSYLSNGNGVIPLLVPNKKRVTLWKMDGSFSVTTKASRLSKVLPECSNL